MAGHENKQTIKIIEIIQKNEVETQDELSALLEKDGFRVTQATVSRGYQGVKAHKDSYRRRQTEVRCDNGCT